MWTARVRNQDLGLTDPVRFSSLVLTERYGPPDKLVIDGDLPDLGPAKDPTTGIVVWDDQGHQRFSGMPVEHPNLFLERRGDGTGTLAYVSDTQRLWDRIVWPTPAAAWTAQTSAYDIQTAPAETRLIGFVTRNAGPTAYSSGGYNRRIPSIRIPTSLGRGPTYRSSGRFQNLGDLTARLAEQGNLRATLQQTYEAGTPYLDLVISETPDLSAWARFGDAGSGDLGFLDEDWRYGVGAPGATVVLSAAGGTGASRSLAFSRDASREAAWGRLVEHFLDQRDTTDAGEITEGIEAAMAENAPTVEVEAPVVAGDLEFGDQAGQVPVGAKVAVSLDGVLVVDRIRQVTTTVQAAEGSPTVTVEPLFGSPDAGIPLDQKALRDALRRLRRMESA